MLNKGTKRLSWIVFNKNNLQYKTLNIISSELITSAA
jgi:hypothetical protein